MVLRARLDEPEGVNLTPMIDMVFNLLIFFLLGSALLTEEREIELDLPKVQQASPLTEAPDEIEINVKIDGTIVVAGEPVAIDRLEDRLLAIRRNYPDQAVAIRGDADTRYENVAQVVALCKKVGVTQLDIVVSLQEAPP